MMPTGFSQFHPLSWLGTGIRADRTRPCREEAYVGESKGSQSKALQRRLYISFCWFVVAAQLVGCVNIPDPTPGIDREVSRAEAVLSDAINALTNSSADWRVVLQDAL